MSYITPFQYYYNSEQIPENLNWGSYQYVRLVDIVNNFLLMNTGNHSLINNEERFKVIFHAKRAIQELHYDAAREIRVLGLEVYEPIKFVLPPDYINWVRLSIYKDGNLLPLAENTQVNSALTYLHDHEMRILFDQDGYCLSPEHSNLDYDRCFNGNMGVYHNPNSPFDGWEGCCGEDGSWYFEYGFGKRFGLDPENSNRNPKFTIDNKAGVINFFSDMANQICVLEYICDGMENGREDKIAVNKLFERYVYAYIKYEILKDKLGVQEYVVARARREMWSLLRNARIRVSNLHPERILMVLRNMQKVLK